MRCSYIILFALLGVGFILVNVWFDIKVLQSQIKEDRTQKCPYSEQFYVCTFDQVETDVYQVRFCKNLNETKYDVEMYLSTKQAETYKLKEYLLDKKRITLYEECTHARSGQIMALPIYQLDQTYVRNISISGPLTILLMWCASLAIFLVMVGCCYGCCSYKSNEVVLDVENVYPPVPSAPALQSVANLSDTDSEFPGTGEAIRRSMADQPVEPVQTNTQYYLSPSNGGYPATLPAHYVPMTPYSQNLSMFPAQPEIYPAHVPNPYSRQH